MVGCAERNGSKSNKLAGKEDKKLTICLKNYQQFPLCDQELEMAFFSFFSLILFWLNSYQIYLECQGGRGGVGTQTL